MEEFRPYKKKAIANIRPYILGESLEEIAINSEPIQSQGGPKEGDMVVQDPSNPKDQWMITEESFIKNYELAK